MELFHYRAALEAERAERRGRVGGGGYEWNSAGGQFETDVSPVAQGVYDGYYQRLIPLWKGLF